MTCLFCSLLKHEIPATIHYEDDNMMIFDDIRPQAPIHKLIIPKLHIATLNDFTEENIVLMGYMTLAAKKIAQELQVDESGYRILMNCNADGGQEVYHLHMHFFAGRQMGWPPG